MDSLEPIAVFKSVGAHAEIEALDIRALLQSSGIDALLIGDSRYPQFPFEVRVPREQSEEARQLIAAAQAAGPDAAEAEEAAEEAAAEAASENQ